MFHLRRHHALLSPQHTQRLNTNSRARGSTSTARDANTHNTEINNRGHSGRFMQAGYSLERAHTSRSASTTHSNGSPAPGEPAVAVPGCRGASERCPHFSCSSAGMLMFQPMACRSKPQVNRLHTGWSSLQAEPHTILLWPCDQAHSTVRAGLPKQDQMNHTRPSDPTEMRAVNTISPSDTSCVAGGEASTK